MDLKSERGIDELSARIRKAYFKLTRRTQGADDCVQEVLTRMLEGRHAHSTVTQAVTDYLRAGSAGVKLTLVSPEKLDYVASEENHKRINASEYAAKVSARTDRAIFRLYFIWGFTEAEIAKLFDVSEGWVSKCLKRIVGEL